MRISILPEDPGYSPQATEVIYAIMVDGMDIDNIVTADEQLSFVDYYMCDELGNLLEEDGEFLIGRVTGDVNIIIVPGICPALIMRAH